MDPKLPSSRMALMYTWIRNNPIVTSATLA
jgi:hypothetical protein